MATKLFLRNTTLNGITDTGDGVVYDMLAAAGAGVDSDVVTLTDGGTEIQWTQSAGGSSVAWISGRVPAGGFTLTSTDISAWLLESNMNDEAEGRYRVYKYTPGVPTITELGGGPFDDGVELSATAITEMTWIGNVTDTAFAENDRILLRLFATNFTTMTAGTATLQFNAADAGTGDSFLNIAETVTFKAEEQTVSGAGAIDTTEAFGTLVASFTVSGAGNIATAEAFGSSQVNLDLSAVGGLTSEEAFGTLAAHLTVSGAGAIATGEAFGDATLSGSGPQTVTGAGAIDTAEAFGTLVASFTVSGAGAIDTAEAFGTLVTSFTVSGAGNIATAEAFGSGQVNLELAAVGALASEEAFGTLAAHLTVSGAGAIDTAEAFGAAAITGVQSIAAAGDIATGEAFGTLAASFTVSGAGAIGTAEAFGSGQLNLEISGLGNITSAEAFGTVLVSAVGAPGSVTSIEAALGSVTLADAGGSIVRTEGSLGSITITE